MGEERIRSVYVDPAKGDDRATGEANEPLKTLTAALQQVVTGSVIYLNPGAYTIESGEVFPLAIAAGITVVGNPASRGRGIALVGSGEFHSPTFAQQSVTLLLEDAAQLRGVTVTNPIAKGSGIWIEDTHPTIAHCTLRQCQREGIFVTGTAKPAITNCLFQGNGASGIAFVRYAKGEVRRSMFLDNGLGIVLSDRAAPLIIDSQFAENRCGLVLSGSCRPVLRGNTIEYNSREGLSVFGNAQPDLGNTAEAAGNSFQGNRDCDLRNQTAIAIDSAGNQISPARVRGVVQFVPLQSVAPPVQHRASPPLPRCSADWATAFIQGLQPFLQNADDCPQPALSLSGAEYQALLTQALQIPHVQPLSADAAVTRLQAIVSLVQGLGLTAGHVGSLAVYSDRAQIPSQSASAVAAATQHRLVVLYPQIERLQPLLPITPSEAAAMIYQALVMQGVVRAIASPYIVNPAAHWVTFADIQGHWAKQWIQGAVSQGWFEGGANGKFEPDAPMSVAEYAEWFAGQRHTLWATEPEQPILRIQVLQSLVEGLPQRPAAINLDLLDRYDDAAAIPKSARAAIAIATQANLVVNYPHLRSLRPNEPATRAEIAAMVYQTLVQLGQCPAIASPYQIDPDQPQQPQPRDPQQPIGVILQPYLLPQDSVSSDEAAEIVLSIAQSVASLLQFQGVEASLGRSPVDHSAVDSSMDSSVDSSMDSSVDSSAGSSAGSLSADLWIGLQLDAAAPAHPDLNGIAVAHLPGLESARFAQLLHKTILCNIDTRSRGVQPADLELFADIPNSIPAVCLSLGCLTDTEDAINLNNAEYRRCLSRAIAESILFYSQVALSCFPCN
ncbi:MAG TPA: DUF1565 domain-containing protein [Coleofasciculaceae cyanobacterium]